MRVLYVIDSLGVGGAERSLFDLTSNLCRVEPTVTHLFAPATLRSQFQSAGIRLLSADLRGKYPAVQAVREVLNVIRTEQPDLVHSTLFRADFASRVACRLAGKPLVTSLVNDSYAPHRFAAAPRSLRWKYKGILAMDRLLASLSFKFVANSRAVAEANRDVLGIPAAKVSVIYRGRDLAKFAPIASERRCELRRELAVPRTAKVGICVGRLIRTKGQLDLIRAVHLMARPSSQFVLLLVGDGPLRAEIQSLLAELGVEDRVRVLGQRHDVPTLLQLADVFGFPSTIEGLPGAVVEAMLAKVPVVASDYAVHRELVEDGTTGCLVPVGNIRALADRISWVLDHPTPAQRMADHAFETARHKFDIHRIVGCYEELYANVLQGWRQR